MVNLIPDWRAVLRQSYTTRIALLGALAEVVLDYGVGVDLPWWVNAGLLLLIVLGRLVKQPALSGPDKEPDYGSAA